VNHTRFLKEDHLPNCERRDNKDTKGGRADSETSTAQSSSKHHNHLVARSISSLNYWKNY